MRLTRLTRRLLAAAVSATVVVGCGATDPSPSPSPSPSPGGGGPLTPAQQRLALIDAFGPLWFCDPDFYPVARDDEAALAVKRLDEVRADAPAFTAIVGRLGAQPGDAFTADQKLTIYRTWKQLNAIALEPAADGRSRFDYLNTPAQGGAEGRRTAGTIGADGSIAIEQQAAAGEPICPICLARGTRIATPDGEVVIEDLRVGMRVWSLDGDWRRIAATVELVGRTPVPATHEVVRLVLDDGRIVRASPGHPLADGRLLAAIRPGDGVDGSTVATVSREPYAGGATLDLLPSGPTGVYWADGIALGSTLRSQAGR